MRLVTWNEKNYPDLPHAQVVEDCRRMARLFGRGPTIIGGQEFGEAQDAAALEGAFSGWQVVGKYPTPILLNPRFFRVLDAGHRRTHGGMPKVSPERGFSWVLVQRRRRPRVRPFVVVNTHYVSGAWSRSPKRDQEWRRDRWREHHAELSAFIVQQNAAGRDAYLLGDMNRRGIDPATFTGAAVTLAEHSLDYVILCPAEPRRVGDVTARVVRDHLHTDHLPVVAEVPLPVG